MIQNAKSIFNIKFEEITKMLKALHYYTEDEVIEKINTLEAFAQENKIEDPRLNQESLLAVGREIRPFYDQLWAYRYQKDWKPFYLQLSNSTRNLFNIEEMKIDGEELWKIKVKQIELEKQLQKLSYKHEIEAKLYEYQQLAKSNILVENKNMMTWLEIMQKYENSIIIEENLKVKDVEFKILSYPNGEFWMGIDADETTFYGESPKNLIKMSQRISMSETLVTQALWEAVMGWNPSENKISNELPVENVTWYDCICFCNQLSALQGYQPCFILSEIKYEDEHIIQANVTWNQEADGYRLPTEAEWEYYAKAGSDLTYSSVRDSKSIFGHKMEAVFVHLEGKSNVVKAKKPNPWGFYDMCGNVFQWCMDEYDPSLYQTRNQMNPENHPIDRSVVWENDRYCSRVIRGGSFRYNHQYSRVTYRSNHDPDERDFYLGFRLCKKSTDKKD
jgi:formylglycine-generating enzyme required for sulfatase activity